MFTKLVSVHAFCCTGKLFDVYQHYAPTSKACISLMVELLNIAVSMKNKSRGEDRQYPESYCTCHPLTVGHGSVQLSKACLYSLNYSCMKEMENKYF